MCRCNNLEILWNRQILDMLFHPFQVIFNSTIVSGDAYVHTFAVLLLRGEDVVLSQLIGKGERSWLLQAIDDRKTMFRRRGCWDPFRYQEPAENLDAEDTCQELGNESSA
jgi:hypothetical protein